MRHVRLSRWGGVGAVALLIALLMPMAALAEDGIGPAGQTLPPTDSPSPSPSEVPTDSPSPSPSPSPSATIPLEGSLVLVTKLIDADADPGTLEDQEAAANWEFDFAVGEGASIGSSGTVTDEKGVAFFEVFFETEASEASITEVLQEDFNLIDVECLAVVEGKGGEQEFFEVEIIQDGTTITFEIFEGELIDCFFVNAAQEVAVASPTTPPPAPAATPTLPASSADGVPPTDRTASLAPILLLLALGASVTLWLVPAPRRLRR